MKYFLLVLFFINVSCNELKVNQKSNIVNVKIDTFDIKNFNDFVSSGGNSDSSKRKFTRYSSISDTIIEEKSIFVLREKERYYLKSFIPPVPNLYFFTRQYNSLGLIHVERERLCKIFLGFKYGVFKFFNKEGNIVKIEDYAEKYDALPFNLDSLISKLEKTRVGIGNYNTLTIERAINAEVLTTNLIGEEMIKEELLRRELEMIGQSNERQSNYFYINPYDREDVKRLEIDINWKSKEWEVMKKLGFGKVLLCYNYETGKLMREEYLIEFPEID